MSRIASHNTPSPSARRLPRTLGTILKIVGGLLIIGFAGLLLYAIGRPIIKAITSGQDVASLERQVRERRTERDTLQTRIDQARTPEGQEGIGRSKGFVRHDEHAIRITVVPTKSAEASIAPTTAASNQRTFWYSLSGAFLLGFAVLFLGLRLRRKARSERTLKTRGEVTGHRAH